MIKVIYIINVAGQAGTEMYIESLVESLNNKKIKAYLVYNGEGLLIDKLKALGVEAFRIKMRHPFDFIAVFKLRKLCVKLGIQIIHTHFLRENYIALLSRIFNLKTKVIYTNHFVIPNNFLVRVFNKILTLFQAKIIAVCNSGKDMMIRNGIDKRKIKVIFNGVDISYWNEPVKSTMREEFDISDEEFVILSTSRFHYLKAPDFLIDCIAHLKKIAQRKFKFVLTNEGPIFEESRRKAEQMGLMDVVVFTGFRKDIKNFVYGSDLFVNSSMNEALSFAIIEVLACGLPVIATNVGGTRDIISSQANCGALVKFGDVEGFATAINRYMEDKNLQELWKKNAVINAKEKFSIEKMISKTYNLYMETIK